jgi:hypothetical protein
LPSVSIEEDDFFAAPTSTTGTTEVGCAVAATKIGSRKRGKHNRVDSPILDEPEEPKEPLFAASAPVVLADLGEWISPSDRTRDLSHETYEEGLPAAKRVAAPVGQASTSSSNPNVPAIVDPAQASTSSSNPDVPAVVDPAQASISSSNPDVPAVVDPAQASISSSNPDAPAAVSALVVDSASTAASVAATTSVAAIVSLGSTQEQILELAKREKDEADEGVRLAKERQKRASDLLAFLSRT